MAERDRYVLPALVAIGAAIFLTGINWGLPSRDVDPYLFGNHKPWSGEEILRLAGPTENPDRSVDVASHPAIDRSAPVQLNKTDEDRARIVRRYRLMSYQPDEWSTLKSLSEMKPGRGNFDPKLYQYGGLWVYPIGVMLKIGSVFHLIDLRPDVAWYMDHPEAFGRFYIVERLWSAMWGMAGVVAIYVIVRRIVGGWQCPAVAACGFMLMPVVINTAHEGKPHLAGAVLTLFAVIGASRYVELGTRRAWIIAGILCGATVAMIVSTLPVFLILPAMVLLRQTSWCQRCMVAVKSCAAGALVYLVANPYVPYDYLFHHAAMDSNKRNFQAMYHPVLSLEGIGNATYLVAAGASPLVAVTGAIGVLALGWRAIQMRRNSEPAEVRRRATGALLAIPALCISGLFTAFAAGKPAEFARFMLLGDLFLLVEAVVVVATFVRNPSMRLISGTLILLSAAMPAFFYLRGFIRDSRPTTSRLVAAEELRPFNSNGSRRIAIFTEPAPYCLPPANLFDQELILFPAGGAPLNSPQPLAAHISDGPPGTSSWGRLWTWTPISWADREFDIGEADSE